MKQPSEIQERHIQEIVNECMARRAAIKNLLIISTVACTLCLMQCIKDLIQGNFGWAAFQGLLTFFNFINVLESYRRVV
jgi:hypothetical protein